MNQAVSRQKIKQTEDELSRETGCGWGKPREFFLRGALELHREAVGFNFAETVSPRRMSRKKLTEVEEAAGGAGGGGEAAV